MNPLNGPFTALERDTLSSTGATLALLSLPGCQELATRLSCISQTHRPSVDQINESIALAATVQRALHLDASPDRWLDELNGLDIDNQTELITDLIDHRLAQAEQVGATLQILHTRATTPTTALI